MNKAICCSVVVLSFITGVAVAQNSSSSDSTLPYSPSLDVTSMDKTVDPCVDFYPLLLRRMAEEEPDSARPDVMVRVRQAVSGQPEFSARRFWNRRRRPRRSATQSTQKMGDFYAACMDEAAVEKRGITPIQPKLDAIAQVKSVKDLAPLVARLQFSFFRYGDSSPAVWARLGAGPGQLRAGDRRR